MDLKKHFKRDFNRLSSNLRLGFLACEYAIEVAQISATRTRGEVDWFLTLSMRAKESPERELVKQLLKIESKAIRNRLLKKMIKNRRFYFEATRPNPKIGQIEGQRARLAKIAKEFGCGNCGERSALCVDYLLKKRPTDSAHHIAWFSFNTSYKTFLTPKGGDHQFCVYDISDSPDLSRIKTWGQNAVIVDGWTNDVYPSADLNNWRFNNFSSLHKLITRWTVNMYDGNFMLDEFIT
jgi:hypothetical protein